MQTCKSDFVRNVPKWPTMKLKICYSTATNTTRTTDQNAWKLLQISLFGKLNWTQMKVMAMNESRIIKNILNATISNGGAHLHSIRQTLENLIYISLSMCNHIQHMEHPTPSYGTERFPCQNSSTSILIMIFLNCNYGIFCLNEQKKTQHIT